MTFQVDGNSEKAIEELKEFFGTKSTAAAIRSALLLARTAASRSKDGTVIVRDQHNDENVRIVVTG
jgi:hypothetical protein